MKAAVSTICIVLLCMLLCFAGNFSDNPQDKPTASKQQSQKQGSEKQIRAADYQLIIHDDTIFVYADEYEVGIVVDSTWDSPLAKLILEDNQ